MSVLIEWLLLALCFALFVSAGVLFTQVLFSLPRSNPRSSTVPRPRIAVLIPAHDEEAVIADTLSSVMTQLRSDDRIVVVADNCSDRTESIAEQCGAEVTRRKDDERRGKGYALDHGIRYLQTSGVEPDVLIVVDADCQLGDGCLQNLSMLVTETGKAVQANYLILPPRRRRSSQTEFAAFASVVKNFVRPLGASRLGLPCLLYGTGMAFPWSIIIQAQLGTSHIVEDLKLAVDLALAGHFCLFCPEALVISHFPEGVDAARSQRRRWEHGYLSTILEYVPILLTAAIRRGSVRLLALALDLFVLPLALLVLFAVVLLGMSALFFWFTYRSAPTVCCLIVIGMVSSAVFLAWARHGREAISLARLFMAPLYVIGNPLYTKFLINRQKTWIRTGRDLTLG